MESFRAAQVEKVESLGTAKPKKGEKGGGCFSVVHPRTVPKWEYLPPGLPPCLSVLGRILKSGVLM